MMKLFFKLILFLFMVAIISLATIIFVPDNISQGIKNWSNSAWQQITSSQDSSQVELPDSGTENENEIE